MPSNREKAAKKTGTTHTYDATWATKVEQTGQLVVEEAPDHSCVARVFSSDGREVADFEAPSLRQVMVKYNLWRKDPVPMKPQGKAVDAIMDNGEAANG